MLQDHLRGRDQLTALFADSGLNTYLNNGSLI